jgi:hypothetical protein
MLLAGIAAKAKKRLLRRKYIPSLSSGQHTMKVCRPLLLREPVDQRDLIRACPCDIGTLQADSTLSGWIFSSGYD